MRRLALIALLATSPAMAAENSIETPAHEVVATAPAPGFENEVELRRYAPMIVAEVMVEASSREAASSKGFRPLAGYIFGANAPRETIAMTAPVTTAPAEGQSIAMTAPVTTAPDGGEGRYAVRFMMPSEWTMETLPVPMDEDVTLREVPARSVAALRFVGDRSPERVAEAQRAVDAFLAARGLEAAGPFTFAGYDAPMVPAERRRWEVQRPVTE